MEKNGKNEKTQKKCSKKIFKTKKKYIKYLYIGSNNYLQYPEESPVLHWTNWVHLYSILYGDVLPDTVR